MIINEDQISLGLSQQYKENKDDKCDVIMYSLVNGDFPDHDDQ